MPLNARQQLHLDNLVSYHCKEIRSKFRRGAEEHGGDLQDMSAIELVDNAIDETLDQFTYLYTLRQKLLSDLIVNQ